MAVKITEENLINSGFIKNEDFEIHFENKGLKLIQSNGYWYPILFEGAQMSCEKGQCVSLNRIQFMDELNIVFFVMFGKKLNQ